MATMIPANGPTPDSTPDEIRVFRALRDSFDTRGWTVIQGLQLQPYAGKAEGEADFLVLVPGQGMLVLEVKGHERIVQREGKILVEYDGGPMKSADRQARDNERAIRQLLQTHAMDDRERGALSGVVSEWAADAKRRRRRVALYPLGPKPLVLAATAALLDVYPEASWYVYPVPRFYDIDLSSGLSDIQWFEF